MPEQNLIREMFEEELDRSARTQVERRKAAEAAIRQLKFEQRYIERALKLCV